MTILGVGTEKGGYILRRENGSWEVEGPLFPGWKVTAWGETSGSRSLAALASNWFGTSLQISAGLKDWQPVEPGLNFPEGSPRKLEQVWQIKQVNGQLYSGVSEAGLFRSADSGVHWEIVEGFNRIPGFLDWQPGLGGLAAHHILTDGARMWVGVSAAGIFRTEDGGETWTSANQGVDDPIPDGEGDPAYCVHGMTLNPDHPDQLWRQDHTGVYRSGDAGDSWERAENGLPANFGFPILRDQASGRLFVFPLEADSNRVPPEGKFRVYRSEDGGDSWQVSGTGLPDYKSYSTVLRNAAVAVGGGEIYFGTTGGQLWESQDAGDSWQQIPLITPRILSVYRFG